MFHVCDVLRFWMVRVVGCVNALYGMSWSAFIGTCVVEREHWREAWWSAHIVEHVYWKAVCETHSRGTHQLQPTLWIARRGMHTLDRICSAHSGTHALRAISWNVPSGTQWGAHIARHAVERAQWNTNRGTLTLEGTSGAHVLRCDRQTDRLTDRQIDRQTDSDRQTVSGRQTAKSGM